MGELTHSFVFVYFKYVLVILEFCCNRFCVLLHVLILHNFEVVDKDSSSELFSASKFGIVHKDSIFKPF
jgi:hypothetical protein